MKNIEFCKELFEKLNDKETDITDRFAILDYFSLKTIQLLNYKDTHKYIELFYEFERLIKDVRFQNIFFAYAKLLENKYFFYVNTDKKEKREYLEYIIKIINGIGDEYGGKGKINTIRH